MTAKRVGEAVNDRKRLRLMYIITRAEHGGAQSHVLELIRAFRDEFDVSVATGEEGFLTETCRAESIPVYLIPHLVREIRPYSDALAVFETLKLIREAQPDLVHAHTWKAGFAGRLAARMRGLPSIYTVHMWHFGPTLPAAWRLFGPALERAAARWGQRVITVSRSGAELGRRYRITEPSRIVAIHNGIADSAERVHSGENPVPIAVMVARFNSFKDHETIVRAFVELKLPARLQLIGGGPTRSAVERLVTELGIGDKVEFLGDRDDVIPLICKADVFVLASKLDNLPISILEAMRAGMPVIASDVGGISELVKHRETGILVAPMSVTPMVEALTDLLGDRYLRERMGRAGRTRYELRFSLQRMIGSTRAVYAGVLGESWISGASEPASDGVLVDSSDAVLGF